MQTSFSAAGGDLIQTQADVIPSSQRPGVALGPANIPVTPGSIGAETKAVHHVILGLNWSLIRNQ